MTTAGKIAADCEIFELTLSLDTSAYADGDLMADVQEIKNVGEGEQEVLLVSLAAIDKDDQGATFDVFFTDDSTTWGTENSAPSQADTVSDGVQAHVTLDTWKDIGGAQIASVGPVNKLVRCASNGSIYVACVSRGTPTYTASGVVLKVGVSRQ